MENLKFVLTIECIFNILTKGILVTGLIAEGNIKQGDELELVDDNTSRKVHCDMLERYLKPVETATKGQYVAIYLSGVSHADISRGMKLIIR